MKRKILLLFAGIFCFFIKSNNLLKGFNVSFCNGMKNDTKHFKQFFCIRDQQWGLIKKCYDTYCISDCDFSSKLRIPKIIHQIWIGSAFPGKWKKFQESWKKYHPDWEYKLWTDTDIEALGLINKDLYDRAKNYGQKSDIARYEILHQFGGLYVDIDFECLRSFDIFHHCLDFYTGVGYNNTVRLYNGLIACIPNHPIMESCIKTMSFDKRFHENDIINITYTTGPFHFTKCFLSENNRSGRNVVFPVNYFYPWPAFARSVPSHKVYRYVRAETFAIHHWGNTWMKLPTRSRLQSDDAIFYLDT